MSSTIALIVADTSIRQVVNTALSDAGYAVLAMEARGLERPGATSGIGAVCLGIDEVARFDRLQQIRAIDSQLPVIVLTTSDEVAERSLLEGDPKRAEVDVPKREKSQWIGGNLADERDNPKTQRREHGH